MGNFKDEKTILSLMQSYKESFDRIEHYGSLFRDKIIVNIPNDLAEAMSELGGIFESINVVAYEAETEHINAEDALSEKKRVEKAAKENYSSYQKELERIAYLRRVRNVFRERKESCEKLITVCQSLLRVANKEKTFV